MGNISSDIKAAGVKCEDNSVQKQQDCTRFIIDPENKDIVSKCTGDGLLTQECINFCNTAAGPYCANQLNTLCASKQGVDGYDDICGCSYPAKTYTAIIDQLTKDWYITKQYMDTTQQPLQCMYPGCQASK